MTRHQKIAARAVACRLEDCREPVMLFTVSGWADKAAADAGRKTNLYKSLYDYEDLLPGGWKPKWLGTSLDSDRLLMVVPSGWRQRQPAAIVGWW